jgi:hypothetical protein
LLPLCTKITLKIVSENSRWCLWNNCLYFCSKLMYETLFTVCKMGGSKALSQNVVSGLGENKFT